MKQDVDDKVIFITTFHPSDSSMKNLVRKNWNILGQNIYNKKLIVGYRRPKNLRDILVNANIPRQEGDERADPNFVEAPPGGGGAD